MNKQEMASYLVNLHTILEAQERTGGLTKSRYIVDEYNAVWAQFKKELQDEARKRDEQERINQSRAQAPSGEPGSGEPTR